MAAIANDNFNPHTLEEAARLYTKARQEDAPEETIQKIVEKTAVLCKDSLFPLIKSFAKCEDYRKTLLDLVFRSIVKELKTAPLSNRLLYEIKYKDKVSGYIVGTIHENSELLIAQNTAVNSDPVFHATVQKCRALVTELGPLSNGLDGALVRTAQKIGIPVLALETEDFQKDLKQKICTSKEQGLDIPKPEIKERAEHLLPKPDLFNILGLYAYLTCDICELGLIKKMDSSYEKWLERERHEAWLKKPITKMSGLVEQLKFSGQKPLCIAVNALSLFGEYGLIHSLSKEFQIAYIGG